MIILKRKVKKTDQDINIVFLLENDYKINGFYYNNETENSKINVNSYKITGICDSRLSELKKYTNSTELDKKYILYNGNNNGIVLDKSTPEVIFYNIDNIQFKDDINGTTFTLLTNKVDNISEKIKFVDDKYYGYVDLKINNRTIVERQNIDIIPDHYKLNSIKLLNDLEFYGSGYFNVF